MNWNPIRVIEASRSHTLVFVLNSGCVSSRTQNTAIPSFSHWYTHSHPAYWTFGMFAAISVFAELLTRRLSSDLNDFQFANFILCPVRNRKAKENLWKCHALKKSGSQRSQMIRSRILRWRYRPADRRSIASAIVRVWKFYAAAVVKSTSAVFPDSACGIQMSFSSTIWPNARSASRIRRPSWSRSMKNFSIKLCRNEPTKSNGRSRLTSTKKCGAFQRNHYLYLIQNTFNFKIIIIIRIIVIIIVIFKRNVN